MNRIDRLTAILIHLQSKRLVKAEELAERFEISLRTVYRDVRALMEAGVPIGSEAGKGYFIVDGYHLPPVMFSQEEASALMLGGKLVEKMTDQSIKKAFESALLKIKSVLNEHDKDHLEFLHSHVEVFYQPRNQQQQNFPDRCLTEIQKSIVNKQLLEIEYFATYKDQWTNRIVEPIGLFYYGGAWHLIAWCQLRTDYRDFRVDRIKDMKNLEKPFTNNNLISFQEYIKTIMQANRDVEKVEVLFDKSVAQYIGGQKYMFGYVQEEDLGDKVRMTFLTAYMHWIARWLISYGNKIKVESPEKLSDMLIEMVEELSDYYLKPVELR